MVQAAALPTAEPAVKPGVPYPLSATPDEDGTNFALYAEQAIDVVGDAAAELVVAEARRTSGTATCPASAPASATATASTVPSPRRRGTASTRASS